MFKEEIEDTVFTKGNGNLSVEMSQKLLKTSHKAHDINSLRIIKPLIQLKLTVLFITPPFLLKGQQ